MVRCVLAFEVNLFVLIAYQFCGTGGRCCDIWAGHIWSGLWYPQCYALVLWQDRYWFTIWKWNSWSLLFMSKDLAKGKLESGERYFSSCTLIKDKCALSSFAYIVLCLLSWFLSFKRNFLDTCNVRRFPCSLRLLGAYSFQGCYGVMGRIVLAWRWSSAQQIFPAKIAKLALKLPLKATCGLCLAFDNGIQLTCIQS